ncbi:crtp3 [Symbiodinium sp. KB8]|nr:crtp3 [Symbiodinium sp. KB8]
MITVIMAQAPCQRRLTGDVSAEKLAINLLYILYGGAILYPRMLCKDVVTPEMMVFPKKHFVMMGAPFHSLHEIPLLLSGVICWAVLFLQPYCLFCIVLWKLRRRAEEISTPFLIRLVLSFIWQEQLQVVAGHLEMRIVDVKHDAQGLDVAWDEESTHLADMLRETI